VVDAPVVRVDLFQDRCVVVRRLALEAPGRQTVVLEELSPLLRERAVSFVGDGIVVEDISVERLHLSNEEADSETAAHLERERELLHHRHQTQEAAARRAQERARRAEDILGTAREQTGRALCVREDPTAWIDGLRALEEAHREARLHGTQARVTAQRTAAELELLERRRDAARFGQPRAVSQLTLRVVVERPGDLEIRYVLPGAVWRPVHRATLIGDALTWELCAMAWNHTGEDWEQVPFVCSTARPGDHAAPPTLTDDIVHTQRRREVVVEVREEVIDTVRAGEERVSGIPGVDDGGEPRTFTAPGPNTLPSNGRPIQFALDRWTTTATRSWIAFPERASEVVLRTSQHNVGSRPLLAGPVSLFRDGLAVGRGEVTLVPPGEPFQIGWGSHDGVRITRRRDHRVASARITGRKTHTFEVALRVVHLGDAPVRIVLTERILVSEVKEVKVSAPQPAPAFTSGPDPDGFCTWALSLEPGETRKLTYTVEVEAPAKVQLPF